MSVPGITYSKAVPVLPAIDLGKSNIFYRDILRFQTSYFGDCLLVKKGHAEIYLFEWARKEAFIASSCFIFVNNIEDVYAQFSGMDVVLPRHQLAEKVRRTKEFCINDINGNTLRFSERRP